MAYEIYKKIRPRREFLKDWEGDISDLASDIVDSAYNKYVEKCKIFQRDNFTCQNKNCKYCKNKKEHKNLTWHHVKFKKNGGKDKAKNGVTLCKGAHKNFHRAKCSLTFPDKDYLPKKVAGHTFRLDTPDTIDWKKVKNDMKELRKSIKSQCGLSVSWKRVLTLLKWLYEENYEN